MSRTEKTQNHYPTAAGSDVMVIDNRLQKDALCGGCRGRASDLNFGISLSSAHEWAQRHARQCKALPR